MKPLRDVEPRSLFHDTPRVEPVLDLIKTDGRGFKLRQSRSMTIGGKVSAVPIHQDGTPASFLGVVRNDPEDWQPRDCTKTPKQPRRPARQRVSALAEKVRRPETAGNCILSQIPQELSAGLTGFGLGPLGTLAVIMFGYIVLGMFMDALSMLVITIPIVFPIIVGLGFDPIWFGVIAVIVIEMGMITPPVGINVFVVKSIAPDVPMGTIFRGVAPFWIAMFICLLILIAFPQIALIIPNSMFG